MRIAFFGSSLLSAYWNGAATYYRGIIRALDGRGHRVTFFEPDAYDRAAHRDLDEPSWAEVVVYAPDELAEALRQARGFDVVVKASGVGVCDEELEEAVLDLGASLTVFWDVDAPATLERLEGGDPPALRSLIREYDVVFTYGGGDPVVERYRSLGAADCVPVYNALDPATHFPVACESRFNADLTFLGNRLPDREARVNEFFFRAAELAPDRAFLLGGSGWEDRQLPENMGLLGHVSPSDHNALNSSALAVLNVARDSMATNGWSPATRVFEAAGAAACVVTDPWEGIDFFLEPGEEVLVASDGGAVAEIVEILEPAAARAIGRAARERVLREHTYDRRAELVEAVLLGARV